MNSVSYISNLPARYTHWCNGGTNIMGVTIHVLVELHKMEHIPDNEAKNLLRGKS